MGQAPGNPLTRSVARLGKCPQRKWETCKPKAQPPWKTSTSSAVVLSSNPVRGQFILAATKQNSKTQLSESSHKVVHLFATIRGAFIAHPQPSPPKCYFPLEGRLQLTEGPLPWLWPCCWEQDVQESRTVCFNQHASITAEL